MNTLTIDINGTCNLACNFCYQDLDGSELTKEQILEIVSRNSKFKTLELGGGEPFLHQELADIVKIVVNDNRKVHISTNATFLPEAIIDLEEKIRNNVTMQVSLHAADREMYQMITSNDLFSRVVANARALKQLYGTVLNAVIYQSNLHQVRDILALGYALAIPTRVIPVMPVGKGQDVALLTPQQIDSLKGILLVEKITHPGMVESPLLHENNCLALSQAYGLEKNGLCPLEAGMKQYHDPRGRSLGCEFYPVGLSADRPGPLVQIGALK